MERREFLGWVGTGAIASFLPVAIAACQSALSHAADASTASANTTRTKTDELVNMGKVSDLDQQGFLTRDDVDVIVVRKSDGSLSALNSACTHQQCPVAWAASSSTLVCPCHGSEFAADGGVIGGPATAPLAQYDDVVEKEGSVLVRVR